MEDLIKRLETAEVGSRELDDSVVIAAFDGEMMDWWDNEAQQYQIRAADGSRVNVTPVTTYLDAALAMTERVLPGWVWQIGNDMPCWAHIWIDDRNYDGNPVQGDGATPALALCIAILRAKQDANQ